jgi:hypothetical protein
MIRAEPKPVLGEGYRVEPVRQIKAEVKGHDPPQPPPRSPPISAFARTVENRPRYAGAHLRRRSIASAPEYSRNLAVRLGISHPAGNRVNRPQQRRSRCTQRSTIRD